MADRLGAPRRYCGAPNPHSRYGTACCVLSKGHSPDTPHKDLAGMRWNAQGLQQGGPHDRGGR